MWNTVLPYLRDSASPASWLLKKSFSPLWNASQVHTASVAAFCQGWLGSKPPCIRVVQHAGFLNSLYGWLCSYQTNLVWLHDFSLCISVKWRINLSLVSMTHICSGMGSTDSCTQTQRLLSSYKLSSHDLPLSVLLSSAPVKNSFYSLVKSVLIQGWVATWPWKHPASGWHLSSWSCISLNQFA